MSIPEISELDSAGTNRTGDPDITRDAGNSGNCHFLTVTSRTFLASPSIATLNSVRTLLESVRLVIPSAASFLRNT
jgi:hypothetical protein